MSNVLGGLTAGLSPSDVKTAIDAVMYERYERQMQPEYLSATDGLFFKQGTTDKLSFIWEENSNVGSFDKTAEQEEILVTDVWIGNQKTKASQKYSKRIGISNELFRADQHGLRAETGRQVGDRARMTQDSEAILNTYGDGFAGSINTTPDGDALYSASHTTLKGATVDNLETGALGNPDNLWTCVNTLAEQKGQDGDAGSHVFKGTLVPFTLYKTAKEVMDSTLVPFSGENQLNLFDTVYGTVQIRASIFLNSTYNSNSNANTSYHIIGENHFITRKVFFGLETELVDKKYSSNDSHTLTSLYHETVFPGSWTATVGSNGTT